MCKSVAAFICKVVAAARGRGGGLTLFVPFIDIPCEIIYNFCTNKTSVAHLGARNEGLMKGQRLLVVGQKRATNNGKVEGKARQPRVCTCFNCVTTSSRVKT